jgi:hypothetical protein
VPEEWEGLWVTVEHPARTDQGGLGVGDTLGRLGVGDTLGVLEMVDEKGVVLIPGGVEQEELQFFPWNSIIRIRLVESGHR